MRFNFPTFVAAAALLAGAALASPVVEAQAEAPTRASIHERAARTSIAPQCWSGTAFPPKAAWSPFPTAFEVGKGGMKYGNDTRAEIKAIHKAILDVADDSGFDPRFILAIMRRESDGATTIPCGDKGRSCGLMQVYGTNVPVCKRHPCPASSIHRMIKCGVQGCGKGAASMAECAARVSRSNYYAQIARCYNTGTVPDPADLSQNNGIGVRSYVQDIGNLLLASDFPTWYSFDDGHCGFTATQN